VGLRGFVLVGPTGVLWRIGQNIPPAKIARNDG
jgi:hypothetical protein